MKKVWGFLSLKNRSDFMGKSDEYKIVVIKLKRRVYFMKKNRNKFFTVMFVFMLSIGMLFGCNNNSETSKPEENNQQTEEPTTRTFTDSAGRKVEIPTTVTKVAPAAGLAEMVLYTINPDKLVGFANEPSDNLKAYMDKKYWDLPVFGQFHGDTFNLEALVAAKPDMIIDFGEAKDTIAEDMDAIQEATGIPTVFIEATLETIPQAYETIGEILGEEEQTKKLSEYSLITITDVKEKAAIITDENRVKVYYGSGDKGLNTNAAGSFHMEVLDFIGAKNVAVLDKVSSKGGGNEISMEQLLLWAPDAIIFAPQSVYESVSNGDKVWKDLEAVKKGAVYEIPSAPYNWLAFPPSVNRILGVKWVGNLLYPEVYDYDMIAETKSFYELFYHYSLTDDEAKELLSKSTLKK